MGMQALRGCVAFWLDPENFREILHGEDSGAPEEGQGQGLESTHTVQLVMKPRVASAPRPATTSEHMRQKGSSSVKPQKRWV